MSVQKLPSVITDEQEMYGERCKLQTLLFNVITSRVPFIRRANIIFTHCSTASLSGSFYIINALFYFIIAIWFCYDVLLHARELTLSSASPCTSNRTQSMLKCFFGLSEYLKQNMAIPVTTATTVWLDHTRGVSQPLRYMTMTIIIIIIIIIITWLRFF